MDLRSRDASYHRRLTTISFVVIAVLCVTVLVGQRYGFDDKYRLVGWKGEMQLLPEITIEPDVPAPEVLQQAATTRPHESSAAAVVPVADRSDFQTARPGTQPPQEGETDPLDVQARTGSNVVKHAASASSYSDTYVILRTVKPKYPEHERERGIEGSVTVELLVNEGGLVANANVLELVGPESFEQSALEAVRQFEFQPPIENGVPTTMWIKFVIKFRINQ